MTEPSSLESRAHKSRGASNEAIYRMVAEALREREAQGLLIDVGCGNGNFKQFIRHLDVRYAGVDAIRFEAFPPDAEFRRADLDRDPIPASDGTADIVVAIETIEHLENPRAFMRELVRIAKPGAWIAITTPNVLSLLSLMTLFAKKRFQQFQDSDYPAHITPLLEIDLRRIAAECGIVDVLIGYSGQGRILMTARHYPSWISHLYPRSCSDNVMLLGKKRT